MKIRDIMRPGTFTISETDTLGPAQAAMTRGRVRHLPVMSEGKLVGILSERDVLAARARDDEGDWWALTVHDAMHSPAQTAGPDDSVTEVAGRMAAARIGAMPVVERGKLLGIATISDVLDAEVRSAMAPAAITLATAADAMTPWPFTVQPDTVLADAVAIMVRHHVRHLPVVDSSSTVVGMLSERDVRSAIGNPVQYVELRRRSVQHRVRDVMTRPAVVVPFDRPLIELARQFADGGLGAIPVVDKFGALIGIVSYVDALRVLAA
ncbi:MAG: Inosine-5-monophosphate dehydrogenase [Deltaproteobacteria bacterium]|nr:Inosine-5-monophosphate dehydrogenase [Deltaproteobacteria bacterium]